MRSGLTSSPDSKNMLKLQRYKERRKSYNSPNAAMRLRKDLTRNAGGSLVSKTADEVMNCTTLNKSGMSQSGILLQGSAARPISVSSLSHAPLALLISTILSKCYVIS